MHQDVCAKIVYKIEKLNTTRVLEKREMNWHSQTTLETNVHEIHLMT